MQLYDMKKVFIIGWPKQILVPSVHKVFQAQPEFSKVSLRHRLVRYLPQAWRP